ncbi:Ribosomal large subunit pseudouridine synthase D [Planctopirus ephydatiae]|uniref:Pseudouridine synthase n=1 Tax=Planctopirus ephydatiae TaxID=2528019 RepID=A0A518GS49_9PLAN|nr:RluA family pseudouridine synthase [Planctopirus ephydatiae]QDV31416.1 Ribosomal large subunit pseudouridine synthase D [Planctopirus ephydatiae]
MSDAPDIASLRHFSTIKNPDKNSEPMAILSKTVTVEKYLAGVRVDSFLVKHFRSYTSWRILRMVAAGLVTIDGQVAATTQRVHPGQQVTIQLAEPPDLYIPPEPTPLEILFEDDSLLVINKPAGLIAHPTGEIPDGTLINAVQYYLDKQSTHPGLERPGIVHRLDRDTSGAMAICKEHLSHRLLSIQFQLGRISKSYLALVEGVLTEDKLVIDLPIGRAPGCSSALMSCRADALEAQASKTSLRVVERFPQHTLVEAKPRTGRMHQIRIHLATIGFPIVGDEFYLKEGEIRPLVWPESEREQVSPLINRQALHAACLSFAHPLTNEWQDFQAPLPDDLRQAIERARHG